MWVPNMAGVCASVMANSLLRMERARAKREKDSVPNAPLVKRVSKPTPNEPFDCLNIVKRTEGK